uniref:Putative secreted protein n=1 Tax=Anopheles darlingi TaxID=43151 RepID=A0A2M4D2X5_ANODA
MVHLPRKLTRRAVRFLYAVALVVLIRNSVDIHTSIYFANIKHHSYSFGLRLAIHIPYCFSTSARTFFGK